MRFALVNGLRSEAHPQLRGGCACCGSPVIPKCGQFKVWHWAHKYLAACDSWTEPETDWHRSWKDQFPSDWQEVVHTDARTNERHIADVKTADGLTIEFQHSYLKREELQARQKFYGRLIWIIDAQPESDSTNASFFRMGLEGPVCDSPKTYTVRWSSSSKLLHKWGEPEIDAYLDFRHSDIVWRLMDFDGDAKEGLVIPVDRDQLIRDCRSGNACLGTSQEKSTTLLKIRSAYQREPSASTDAKPQRRRKDTGQMSLF